MYRRALLLCLYPEYAREIFRGVKTVELRRTRPNIPKGSKVFVYVTSPIKSIVGYFEVGEIKEGNPAGLWSQVGKLAGVSKEKFDQYYSGAKRGYGICIKRSCLLKRPVMLGELKGIWEGFYPPRCYRYIDEREILRVGGAISSTKKQLEFVFSNEGSR